jgi:hypothetical protein
MKSWFLVLAVLVFSGCVSIVSRATINSCIDPNFSATNIKKIAVFPLRNARLAPNKILGVLSF